jgi:hypothetical protein
MPELFKKTTNKLNQAKNYVRDKAHEAAAVTAHPEVRKAFRKAAMPIGGTILSVGGGIAGGFKAESMKGKAAAIGAGLTLASASVTLGRKSLQDLKRTVSNVRNERKSSAIWKEIFATQARLEEAVTNALNILKNGTYPDEAHLSPLHIFLKKLREVNYPFAQDQDAARTQMSDLLKQFAVVYHQHSFPHVVNAEGERAQVRSPMNLGKDLTKLAEKINAKNKPAPVALG